MVDPVSLAISTLSLAVSAVTAWLTLFRRGTVKMTQPTVIFFGPDVPRSQRDTPLPKVYLRTLLFSTSKRGRVIESMHVALSRNEMHQNFNIWVYGEREKLVRGSGLFVGKTGISGNHHFLTPEDGKSFSFIEGHHKLEVFAHLLGDVKPIKLFSQQLDISRDIATALREKSAGLYFDWGPDSSRYLPHVQTRPPSSNPKFLLLKGVRVRVSAGQCWFFGFYVAM
jgi:hypothetical protein